MKSTYTFKATPRDTDYVRICRENHQARFIVVKTEGAEPLTFVRLYSSEHSQLRCEGLLASARIDVPPNPLTPGRAGRTYVIYDGDHSAHLAPAVRTIVEAYS
jgi:hypothetical protein